MAVYAINTERPFVARGGVNMDKRISAASKARIEWLRDHSGRVKNNNEPMSKKVKGVKS